MATINGAFQGLSLNARSIKDLVCVEDYGIFPKPSAKQRLSPLDLNMPRFYGSRWVLCFALSADADTANVYVRIPLTLCSHFTSLTLVDMKN